MKRLTYLAMGFIILFGCKSYQRSSTTDYSQTDDAFNLHAFIGKKLSIEEIPTESSETIEIDSITGDTTTHLHIYADYVFRARYKVIHNVFNELPDETVEFMVLDHYGRPQFSKHKHVMLYLSLDSGSNTFYHRKYKFDPVKRVNGQWVGVKGESLEKLLNDQKNNILKVDKMIERQNSQ